MAVTSLYVMRRLLFIMLSNISQSRLSPLLSIVITQERAYLSSPSFKLHAPLESALGSMGSTLSGKYTLVPRR